MSEDYTGNILIEDFNGILSAKLDWYRLRGKVVLVTGGTGFIGSLIIKFLNFLNDYQYDIKIISIVRDIQKAENMYHNKDVQFILGDIRNMPKIKGGINFIFHCAATTCSKSMIKYPVEVGEGIVGGTLNVCRLAKEKQVESMVYLSSMEIYGSVSEKFKMVTENDLGDITILDARSSYSLGKRMAENICFSYFAQYNVPVKIARLAQTFGVGISKEENRVFAQFAQSVIKQEDIILYTAGDSRGNYCYSADVIVALFTLLLKGESGEAYNVANKEASMTILEMAKLVAKEVSGGEIKVVIDSSQQLNQGFAPKTAMKLSTDKIEQLGWGPTVGLLEMYVRMIKWMEL